MARSMEDQQQRNYESTVDKEKQHQAQRQQQARVSVGEFLDQRIPANSDVITPQMVPLAGLDQHQLDAVVRDVPGGAHNVLDIYPLSTLQEGMLFHRLLNEKNDTYVLTALFEVMSLAHIDALKAALQRVIDRHDAFRTAVLWEDLPRPMQVVYREARLRVEELTLRPEQDVRAQLDEFLLPSSQAIDLRHAPLLHLVVAHDSLLDKWYAFVRVHHIICDHQSLNTALAEAMACLEGCEQGLATAIPYGNYVRHALQAVSPADDAAFFRGKLGSIEEPTAPFGLVDTHGDRRISDAQQLLDPALVIQLRANARRLGVSVARMLHAVWALVVARTSGRDDIVFGTVVLASHLRGPQSRRMLGMAVNTLPLRLQLNDISVESLVAHTSQELTQLLSHEHASLQVAQQCTGIASTTPLFTALLNCRRSAAEGGPESTNGGVRMLGRGEAWTNYPITLIVDDLGDGLLLTAQVDRRIDPKRILLFVQAAAASLVEALTRAPGTLALELAILPAGECQQVLEQFNATRLQYPREKLIHQLFEEQVERTPHEIAVRSGTEHLTYRQLNCRANQLARYLTTCGAGPDRFVGLFMERGVEMVIGLFGILKSGSAYLALDPQYPLARLEYMLKDTAPIAVLTQERLKMPMLEARRVIALDTEWSEIAQRAATNLGDEGAAISSDNLAYIIYTSGSTGQPKGVAIEHRQAVNLIVWAHSTLPPEMFASTLQSTSLNFDLSVYECFVPLTLGGSIRVMQNGLSLASEPAEVTLINTVPSAIAAVLDARAVPPGTRVVNLAGETLQGELVERIFAHSCVEQVCNLYGPSETTTYSTWIAMSRQDGFIKSIGRPIANTRIYILDRHRQPVPIGVAGEIFIGGDGVARGYLNRPELTAARFLKDPFSDAPQARMYMTGDLGRWRADGMIEYLGRNDHQVKIRGFRVELGEIEAQVMRHERVKQAVVIAREDAPGEKRLVAYVVAANEIDPPEGDDLREHLKADLPAYMVPSGFVVLKSLPLTPNGKLDRNALPAPELRDCHASREYVAPQGEVEEILAGIWHELLKVEQVGRHDNFFELGGHSLLIVRMMARLRQLGLSTDVRRVFDNPTLADLASMLTGHADERIPVPPNLIPAGCDMITPKMLPLVKLLPEDIERIVNGVPGGAPNIQDIYPLSPSQEGLLFHHLLTENTQAGDVYLVPTLLLLDSRQRLDELVAALQAVVDRHDVLRTAILWKALPMAVQVVYRKATLPVKNGQLDGRDTLVQVNKWLSPEYQRMDLQRAPLLQLQVAADPKSERWYVLVQLHHIIADNVSSEIILAEVAAHMQGFAEQLLLPSVPYRDHVVQSLAHADDLGAEAFFRSKFRDVDEPTAPFGLLNVRGDGGEIEEAQEELDPPLSRRVRMVARRFGVSTAALFHAAWSLVLAHTSGREDVVFGTVLLGRMQSTAEGQHTLGMFINTLPLRLQLAGLATKQLIETTQRELIELMSHEQSSLALAQRCSGVSGSMPLFSALLNYRHTIQDVSAGWAGVGGIEFLARHDRTNYPIVLAVDDHGSGFHVAVQITGQIDPKRLVGYLRTTLHSLVETLEHSPQQPALQLSIVPASERHELLEHSSGPRVSYQREQLVHQLFEQQAARTPHELAVTCEGQSLTYAELNARANQLARYLRARGVDADQLVGLCVKRSLELFVGVLGILKAGGAYVPLDPSYPAERLEYMVTDSSPRLVLAQQALKPRLSRVATQVVVLDGDWQEIAEHSAENLDARALGLKSSHLAYVIYTSGSTGNPKGVMVQHFHGVNLLVGLERLYGGAKTVRRMALNASFNFDASVQQLGSLVYGCSIVVVPQEVRRDVSLLLSFLEEQQIEGIDCTPTQLKAWLAGGMLNRVGHSLRMVLVGGEAIDPALWNSLTTSSRIDFYNVYGPTECTVDSTAAHLNGDGSAPHIGRPMANRRIYILGPGQQLVPMGAPGEIYIAGDGVARGYLNRAELTAERFLMDPFNSEAPSRMYKTGDLGRLRDDGAIQYLGRNDHQVKIRGFRIELGEIEAQLARHECVQEAVVLAREDVPGEKRLVAYVVAYDASDITTVPTVDALRAHVQAELPEHMVPSAFVMLERLPLTPNGKLDRRALPVPEFVAYAGQQHVAPEGSVQEQLAKIWQELLHIERIGRHDHFFELGGHSLLVLKLLAQIADSFGSALRVADVYQSPTLEELAGRIQGSDAVEDAPVDLAGEAVLDDALVPIEGTMCVPPRSILLTGATGFVGRFLLAQLLNETGATIFCIVRARTKHQAAVRLKSTLSASGLWHDELGRRLVAIPGDMRQPHLGIEKSDYDALCRDVDSIYHCATSMNHLETYAMAKAANVGSANELLTLATTGKRKLVNYISSLSVFGRSPGGVRRTVNERSSIDQEQHLSSQGYTASKWVGEKILLLASQRGIPCNIFRVGLVWADSEQGRFDELQHVYRVLKTALLSGFGIEEYNYTMPPTPVDYVARSVVALAGRFPGGNEVFHISSSTQTVVDVFERIRELSGIPLKLMPHYDWVSRIGQLHEAGQSLPAVPLIEFAFSMGRAAFEEQQRHADAAAANFDCTFTHRELERAGILTPVFSNQLLEMCIAGMLSRDRDLQGVRKSLSEPTVVQLLKEMM